MKRLVALIAFLAVLAAGAAAVATAVRWNGGLGGGYGNAEGLPVQVDAPFSLGDVELRSNDRIRIEAVRLHRATPGVELLGALVYPMGRGVASADRSFPPRFPRVRMRAAVGAIVDAHTRLGLVVGMRATRLGPFRVRGFDLLYRERWHGIELRRKAHVGAELDGCAARTAKGISHCPLPGPFGNSPAG